MILANVEKSFWGEFVVATQFGGSSKLKFGAMGIKEFEGSFVHHRGKNLRGDIHEHHTSPFVWVC
jgi:hypothetical protein